ncbi:MAG: hypothetical protein HZC51_04780 [Nitrospirae bacterium]|nr:hypothetical protein [Nitrospirota bacterium]
MTRLLVTVALVLAVTAPAIAHTASNRFWGEVPVDMLLSGDALIVKPLVVADDVTLTIEPGTVVRFEGSKDGGNRIVVKGRLVAVGTKGKPIRFIPKDAKCGPWYGLEFAAGGGGRIENCIIEGATKGIVDEGKKVSVKGVSFVKPSTK